MTTGRPAWAMPAATFMVATALAAGAGLPCAPASAADAAGRTLNTPPSPLEALLEDTGTPSSDARRTLAKLLVDALIDAYAHELEAVRAALAEDDTATARLASWYRATRPILDTLEAEREALPDARRIELYAERGGDVLMLLDGRPVWLSWPRPSARPRLERGVVAAYCAQHPCEDDGEAIVGYADAFDAGEVSGAWSVTQQAPPTWQSDRGVQCMYTSLASRADKEAACREAIVELHRLARAIDRARRGGALISWQDVALVDADDDVEQRVAVNARGDHVLLPLPTLAGEAVDWDEGRRWLEARAAGRAIVATVRRPVPGAR